LTTLLIDTHVVAWLLLDSPKLAGADRERIGRFVSISYSAISQFEIIQKARTGSWPEIAAYAGRLTDLCRNAGLRALPVTAPIASAAAALDWANRDPFDRLIAATAIEHDMPVLTMDRQFAGLAHLRLA